MGETEIIMINTDIIALLLRMNIYSRITIKHKYLGMEMYLR
jgi:hypothetical protein